MEIAEVAEEESRAKRQSTVLEERPPTTNATISGVQTSTPSLQPELPPALPESTSFNSMVSEAGSYASPAKESSDTDGRSWSPVSQRRGSQSTRSDAYSSSLHGYTGRPKVKLGPRPSLDVAAAGGRPHTSGAASYYRPVSTLPPGMKPFSRGSRKEKDREKHPGDPPTMTILPPPMGELRLTTGQHVHTRPHTSGGRPNASSEPLLSPTLSSPSSISAPKVPIITPEKARLMKALQLRNKKKLEAAASSTEPSSPHPPPTAPANPNNSNNISMRAPKEVEDTLATLDNLAKADDSGIGFDASSALRTDESDATRSDSFSVSPVGASEMAESTKASSISGSTDETVQEPVDLMDEPHGSAETESKIAIHDNAATNSKDSSMANPVKESKEYLEQLSPSVYNPSQQYVHVTAVDTDAVKTTERWPPSDTTTLPRLASQLPESPEKEMSAPKASLDEPSQLRLADSVSEIVLLVDDAGSAASEKSPAESTFSAGSDGIPGTERLKRKGLVEPIRTDVPATGHSRTNSETQFLSDEEFMDELSSAVVQEAKPISVSKSPASSVFPSPHKLNGEQSKVSRVFSTPLRIESTDTSMLEPPSHEQRPPSRSVSAGATTYLNRINQQQSAPLAKKVNLGSGISQRIKALEKLSSLDPAAAGASTGTAGSTQGASTAFFSVRKGVVRGKSPSIAERANSLKRNSPGTSSPEPSLDGAKVGERSESVRSRLDNSTSAVSSTNLSSRSQPESISVTARIVRDPSQSFPANSSTGNHPMDYSSLDLQQSPLVIDHQMAVVQPSQETILERRLSSRPMSANDHRSSVTINKDLIRDGRSSFSERRRSINIDPSGSSQSLRSSSRPPSARASPARQRQMSTGSRVSTSSGRDHGNSLSPPPTAGSSSSAGTTGDEKSDKKSNRASRIMRQMSSSLSTSRKTLAHALSPTVREESEPLQLGDSRILAPSCHSSGSTSPTGVEMGDVNVQFPDSLLWKRRSMLLDSQGFLVMSPALAARGNGREKSNAGVTRRFHLSEFRTPCIPDVEMQELPNSVVLDFIEGGGLQVACEDRAGQMRILDSKLKALLSLFQTLADTHPALQDAHRTWQA